MVDNVRTDRCVHSMLKEPLLQTYNPFHITSSYTYQRTSPSVRLLTYTPLPQSSQAYRVHEPPGAHTETQVLDAICRSSPNRKAHAAPNLEHVCRSAPAAHTRAIIPYLFPYSSRYNGAPHMPALTPDLHRVRGNMARRRCPTDHHGAGGSNTFLFASTGR